MLIADCLDELGLMLNAVTSLRDEPLTDDLAFLFV
jgi:hypothetical protein